MCGEIVRNAVGFRPLLEVTLARYAVVGERAAGHPAERVENRPDDWTLVSGSGGTGGDTATSMPRAGRLRHVPGRDPGCGPLLSCPQISAEIQNQPCCYAHGLMNGHGCSSCVKQCERFLNFIHFPITSGNGGLNRLNCYDSFRVSRGEGVHVGADKVAEA